MLPLRRASKIIIEADDTLDLGPGDIEGGRKLRQRAGVDIAISLLQRDQCALQAALFIHIFCNKRIHSAHILRLGVSHFKPLPHP